LLVLSTHLVLSSQAWKVWLRRYHPTSVATSNHRNVQTGGRREKFSAPPLHSYVVSRALARSRHCNYYLQFAMRKWKKKWKK
jgi:hypothetical protein